MDIWFTGDRHFYHKNILRHMSARSELGSTVEEMNEALVELHNAYVKPGDLVYDHGDVSFGGVEDTGKLLDRLNGQLYLIIGNHDKVLENSGLKKKFCGIKDRVNISINDDTAIGGKRRIVAGHYSQRTWDKMHYGSWHTFGHSHGTLPMHESIPAVDVGVDSIKILLGEFRPINYEELRMLLKDKQWQGITNDEDFLISQRRLYAGIDLEDYDVVEGEKYGVSQTKSYEFHKKLEETARKAMAGDSEASIEYLKILNDKHFYINKES